MQPALPFEKTCAEPNAVQWQRRSGGWLGLVLVVSLCFSLLACKANQASVGHSAASRSAVAIQAETTLHTPSDTAANTVPLASLPVLEQQVYRLIFQGGPFSYSKDGAVFANRERLLPARKRGFYHEYTVASPQAPTRGARRIVCGGPRQNPEVCYYTADHYASFQRIVP